MGAIIVRIRDAVMRGERERHIGTLAMRGIVNQAGKNDQLRPSGLVSIDRENTQGEASAL